MGDDKNSRMERLVRRDKWKGRVEESGTETTGKRKVWERKGGVLIHGGRRGKCIWEKTVAEVVK